MKLLPHRDETTHGSNTDFAAEYADKVHESGKRGGFGCACQGARFKSLQNDTAYQADLCTREPNRQHKLLQCHPREHMTSLKSPVMFDVAQDSGYKQDGGIARWCHCTGFPMRVKAQQLWRSLFRTILTFQV